MAQIWFVKSGESPTKGDGPYAERSLEWCVNNLGLRQADWKTPLGSPPEIGDSTPLNAFRAPQHVVVQVENEDITDLSGKGWKSGFYLPQISMDQVKKRLQSSN
jgi:hypothetical protein